MNPGFFDSKNNKKNEKNKRNKTVLELICLLGLLTSNIFFVFPTSSASVFSVSSFVDTNQKNRILKVDSKVIDSYKPLFNGYDKYKDQFSRDYEFIFFHSDGCPYCKSFAPILKKYSDNLGINVRSFVVGGDPSLNPSSSYFSNSTVANQEMIEQFFGFFNSLNFSNKETRPSVPALFVMNKNSLHAYPVSQGALTYLELAKRMNELKPQVLRYEYNMVCRDNKNNQINKKIKNAIDRT